MSAIEELQSAITTVAERVGPSVVGIGSRQRGSGVVVADGRVLTNAHNIRGDEVTVTFADGRSTRGRLGRRRLGRRPRRHQRRHGRRQGARVGGRGGRPRVGTRRVRRGGDARRRRRASRSAPSRRSRGPSAARAAGGSPAPIEHTAPLAPGSSGGAAARLGRPAPRPQHEPARRGLLPRAPGRRDAARARRRARLAASRRQRPRLGVAVAPAHVARRLRRSVGLPERDGLLVRGVEDGSLAAKAGIQEGDLIVDVAGTAVTDADALLEALAAAATPFEVKIVRGHRRADRQRRRPASRRRGLSAVASLNPGRRAGGARRWRRPSATSPRATTTSRSSTPTRAAVSAVAETLIPSVASLRVSRAMGRLGGGRRPGRRSRSRPTASWSRRPTSWPARTGGPPRSSTGASASFRVVGRDPLSDLAVIRADGRRRRRPAGRRGAPQGRPARRRDRQPARLRGIGHGRRRERARASLAAARRPREPARRERHPDRRRAQPGQLRRRARRLARPRRRDQHRGRRHRPRARRSRSTPRRGAILGLAHARRPRPARVPRRRRRPAAAPAGRSRRTWAARRRSRSSSSSTAARRRSAGVRPGDLIVELDGRPIEGVGDLQRLLDGDLVGRKVGLRVARGNRLLDLPLTQPSWPDPSRPSAEAPRASLRLLSLLGIPPSFAPAKPAGIRTSSPPATNRAALLRDPGIGADRPLIHTQRLAATGITRLGRRPGRSDAANGREAVDKLPPVTVCEYMSPG